jgi:hypothetical protein
VFHVLSPRMEPVSAVAVGSAGAPPRGPG